MNSSAGQAQVSEAAGEPWRTRGLPSSLFGGRRAQKQRTPALAGGEPEAWDRSFKFTVKSKNSPSRRMISIFLSSKGDILDHLHVISSGSLNLVIRVLSN